MTDPTLDDLTMLAAVVSHRSFRKAALERRVSVSSVSQRIRDLEARLGVRLLNRTTRSVAPTEAGELLLRRLDPALAQIHEAIAEVRERQSASIGRLRINAPAPAIHLVLAPMVTPFLKRFPGVELEIISESLLKDVVAEGFDAGVRYEESLALDMVAISLGPPQRFAVVASPEFLQTHGAPKEPADLLGYPTISTIFPNRAWPQWEFEKEGRVIRIAPKGPFSTSDPRIQVQAAVDGLGFLATFLGYVEPEIAAGRLVSVLDDWCAPFSGPFLYYPSRRQPTPALKAFLAFVRDWTRDHG